MKLSAHRQTASCEAFQILGGRVLRFVSAWFSVLLGVGAFAADEAPRLAHQDVQAAVESIQIAELKNHVGTLASDALQGREAGTVAGHAASAYLMTELRKYGVTPAGDSQFLQEFNGNMRNLLACVRGRDPQLADEVVIVCAHYDHVGYGTPRNSRGPIGFIHNGADDNASGTAGLLEVIEAVKSLSVAPRRTLLFAFWDGEEKGLLGSKHWVSAPTLPLQRVKLVINADMIGRLRPEGVEVTGHRTARGLRHLLSDANSPQFVVPSLGGTPQLGGNDLAAVTRLRSASEGVSSSNSESSSLAQRVNFETASSGSRTTLKKTPEGGTTNIAPQARLDFTWDLRADSDHHPFIAAGVPAFMLHTGKHDDYHRPSDDADKLNYEGIQQVARLMLLSALHAAEADSLPPFRPESRSENKPLQQQVEAPAPAPASRLGIAWKQDLVERRIVEISEVTPESPAAAAGLRVGDRIERFAGHAVSDVADFRTLVVIADRDVTATVRRPGRSDPLELSVRLNGEPTRLGLTWRADDAEPSVVILTQVLPHSPAALAGLKPLDRIRIFGEQPATKDHVTQAAATLPFPIPISFERDGVLATTSIPSLTSTTVAAKPPQDSTE